MGLEGEEQLYCDWRERNIYIETGWRTVIMGLEGVEQFYYDWRESNCYIETRGRVCFIL